MFLNPKNLHPPAPSTSSEWRWAGVWVGGNKKGDDLFPGDGTDALAPLYQENVDKVRDALLKDFKINDKTLTLQLGLDSEQTPAVIEDLNRTGEVVLDPIFYGHVLPDRHLSRLRFLMEYDASPAPASQRVISVRSLGTTPGAVISCTPDLADRADGFDNVVRIYDKGTDVKLGVPEHAGGAVFDSWDIVVAHQPSQPGVKAREIKVKLDEYAVVQCHWAPARVAAENVVSNLQISPRMLKQHLASQSVDEQTRAQLVELMESPAAAARGASILAPARLRAGFMSLQ